MLGWRDSARDGRGTCRCEGRGWGSDPFSYLCNRHAEPTARPSDCAISSPGSFTVSYLFMRLLPKDAWRWTGAPHICRGADGPLRLSSRLAVASSASYPVTRAVRVPARRSTLEKQRCRQLSYILSWDGGWVERRRHVVGGGWYMLRVGDCCSVGGLAPAAGTARVSV